MGSLFRSGPKGKDQNVLYGKVQGVPWESLITLMCYVNPKCFEVSLENEESSAIQGSNVPLTFPPCSL